MSRIKLMSSQGRIFVVDAKVIKRFRTIQSMFECGCVQMDNDIPLPILNVNSATLEKIIEWAEHHKNDNLHYGGIDHRVPYQIPLWDYDFLNVSTRTLCEIINAANYLDIQQLLDLSCKKMANLLLPKSTEEIRDFLDIQNDFTPEEEEQVHQEHSWSKHAGGAM